MTGKSDKPGLLARLKNKFRAGQADDSVGAAAPSQREAPPPAGRLIRPSEAARLLGVSRSIVYAWYHRGLLEGVRLGVHADPKRQPLRLYEESVLALLERGEPDG